MKSSLAGILIIIVGIVSFIVGYSVAPTDIETVRHGAVKVAAMDEHDGGSSDGESNDGGGYGQ